MAVSEVSTPTWVFGHSLGRVQACLLAPAGSSPKATASLLRISQVFPGGLPAFTHSLVRVPSGPQIPVQELHSCHFASMRLHVSPLKPLVQIQFASRPCDTHSAPFLHGLSDSHISTTSGSSRQVQPIDRFPRPCGFGIACGSSDLTSQEGSILSQRKLHSTRTLRRLAISHRNPPNV